jgi:hypothetical protein
VVTHFMSLTKRKIRHFGIYFILRGLLSDYDLMTLSFLIPSFCSAFVHFGRHLLIRRNPYISSTCPTFVMSSRHALNPPNYLWPIVQDCLEALSVLLQNHISDSHFLVAQDLIYRFRCWPPPQVVHRFVIPTGLWLCLYTTSVDWHPSECATPHIHGRRRTWFC